MVSKYKRPAGARRYKDYSEETLVKCLKSVREDGTSIKTAALVFNIPERTIYSKLKTDVDNVQSPGHPNVFSAAEENSIMQHLLLLSEFDLPITQHDLMICVGNYLKKTGRTVPQFKDNMPGRDWVHGFLHRHPEISQRIAENVKLVRAEVDEPTIIKYHEHLAKTLEGIDPQNIYNFDETNLTDNPGKRKVCNHLFFT